jgi:peptidoglycan-associated lipoprotein
MERRQKALLVAAAVFAAVFALSGCQQTGPPGSGDSDGGTGDDFGVDDGSIETVETVDLSDLKTIYFDYDRSTIRADQRSNLTTDAEAIKARTDLGVVTLQGNCDERGSEEYNLALGERRASAVKQYLVDLGVSASRLRTVSFGESKPSVAGHDESAWKWNRRVDFAVNR